MFRPRRSSRDKLKHLLEQFDLRESHWEKQVCHSYASIITAVICHVHPRSDLDFCGSR